MSASIELDDVHVDLPGFHLDINLKVEPSEHQAIIGESGSGKTTLLETIAGLQKPKAGRIFIGEKEVTGLPPEKRNVGYLPQGYALFPHMTVEENVGYGLTVRKLSPPERRRRVEKMMELTRISHVFGRYPRTLSGGERQKVALARALTIEPDVLLLDEPLSALDPTTQERVGEELKALQRTLGITTIHVTHDLEEAVSFADRIAVMGDGKIVDEGTPREIVKSPTSVVTAKLVGFNLLWGTVENINREFLTIRSHGFRVRARHKRSFHRGEHVWLGIDKRAGKTISLHPRNTVDDHHKMRHNHIPGRIRGVLREDLSSKKLLVDLLNASGPVETLRVIVGTKEETLLSKGMPVWVKLNNVILIKKSM